MIKYIEIFTQWLNHTQYYFLVDSWRCILCGFQPTTTETVETEVLQERLLWWLLTRTHPTLLDVNQHNLLNQHNHTQNRKLIIYIQQDTTTSHNPLQRLNLFQRGLLTQDGRLEPCSKVAPIVWPSGAPLTRKERELNSNKWRWHCDIPMDANQVT